MMCWLQWGGIKNLDPTTQARFDEFWNNNMSLQHKPKTLCNDRCEMTHTPMFDLGLKGKCVIIPCIELPTLWIDDSFEATNLTKF